MTGWFVVCSVVWCVRNGFVISLPLLSKATKVVSRLTSLHGKTTISWATLLLIFFSLSTYSLSLLSLTFTRFPYPSMYSSPLIFTPLFLRLCCHFRIHHRSFLSFYDLNFHIFIVWGQYLNTFHLFISILKKAVMEVSGVFQRCFREFRGSLIKILYSKMAKERKKK